MYEKFTRKVKEEVETKSYMLTAAEARQIAHDSILTEKRIFKQIRDCAKENLCHLHYIVDDTLDKYDDHAMAELVANLKAKGFEVDFISNTYEDDTENICVDHIGFEISW